MAPLETRHALRAAHTTILVRLPMRSFSSDKRIDHFPEQQMAKLDAFRAVLDDKGAPEIVRNQGISSHRIESNRSPARTTHAIRSPRRASCTSASPQPRTGARLYRRGDPGALAMRRVAPAAPLLSSAQQAACSTREEPARWPICPRAEVFAIQLAPFSASYWNSCIPHS
ncbi:hypothetical protein [Paraburkholderia sp. DGU8]|uniref:hypothetical protein n=1 Tax=Paraburkholderia sp. DGU8 TaxID=3161997 RepID=UPI0034661EE8